MTQEPIPNLTKEPDQKVATEATPDRSVRLLSEADRDAVSGLTDRELLEIMACDVIEMRAKVILLEGQIAEVMTKAPEFFKELQTALGQTPFGRMLMNGLGL